MKSLMKSVLLLLLASGALVFAGGGLECPTCGQPPHGIGLEGNATGTKLNGVIMIEFYDIQSNASADARIVLRLRKGKDFAVFYDETPVSDYTNPSAVQTEITNELTPEILARFFNSAALTIKVKSMQEFGELDTVVATDLTARSVFILANVELAVQ